MIELLLIRHGQTSWNVDKRVIGSHPVPLNATGRRQAERLASSLRHVSLDAIYTSPFLRTKQTAECLGRGRKIKIIPSKDLIEVDFGAWVGKSFNDLKNDPLFKTYYTHPKSVNLPGGERLTDVRKRTRQFLRELEKKHKNGRIAIVSHADVIKTIVSDFLKNDLNDIHKIRIDHASLTYVVINARFKRLICLNAFSILDSLFDKKRLTA